MWFYFLPSNLFVFYFLAHHSIFTLQSFSAVIKMYHIVRECLLCFRDNLDDPLDDTATVFQQLEQLCTVSRCEYEKTCTLLVQLFDQNAQNYQKLLHSASGLAVDMAIQEGQFVSHSCEQCAIVSRAISHCQNLALSQV